jgi:cytochrome c-type biogenesis protein CcmE
MKPKRKRLYLVLAGMVLLGAAAGLVLFAFQDNLVFFRSPSDIADKGVEEGRRFRLGGMVEEGSVVKEGITVHFRVTDYANAVAVEYTGLLPDLFREGQGVVTEGRLGPTGTFVADTVLAKHDENYMPPEVAEALEKSGGKPGMKAGFGKETLTE